MENPNCYSTIDQVRINEMTLPTEHEMREIEKRCLLMHDEAVLNSVTSLYRGTIGLLVRGLLNYKGKFSTTASAPVQAGGRL